MELDLKLDNNLILSTTFNSFSLFVLLCFRSADLTDYKVCELFR